MNDRRLMTCEEYRGLLGFLEERDPALHEAIKLVAEWHEGAWDYPWQRRADAANLHRVLAGESSWEAVARLVWQRDEAALDEPFRRGLETAFRACVSPPANLQRLRRRLDAMADRALATRSCSPLTPEEYHKALEHYRRYCHELAEAIDEAVQNRYAGWSDDRYSPASIERLHAHLADLTSWEDAECLFRRCEETAEAGDYCSDLVCALGASRRIPPLHRILGEPARGPVGPALNGPARLRARREIQRRRLQDA